MTETVHTSELDHTAYSSFSGLKIALFILVFFISGFVLVFKTENYFSDFWKISQCDASGYSQDRYITYCGDMVDVRYGFGVVYFGIQKELVRSAKNADVVIFGNSRTARSFSTEAIDKTFKDRGLTYVILAAEGSGYKSALMTTEKLGLKPKIVLINNEIFYIDTISSVFSDIVNFPEQYETRYKMFHNAQQVQRIACEYDLPMLEGFYCNGEEETKWRSTVNGRVEWDLVEPNQEDLLIDVAENSRMQAISIYMNAAEEMLGHRNFKSSCPILYLVNSPVSSPRVLDTMGQELHVQTVFKNTPGLYTYDTSHMDLPNSNRWAEDFVTELGPALDACLEGNGRPKPESLSLNAADLGGLSDFEKWIVRLDAKVTNEAAIAPDGTQTADEIHFRESASRVVKVFRNQPVNAGDTLTFNSWLWSEDFSRLRIQMIRSCTKETPVETKSINLTLTPSPQKYELEMTFEHSHGCVLVQILGLEDDMTVYAWNSKLGVSPAAVDVATPQ